MDEKKQPRKVRLSGKMREIPADELKKIVGGGNTNWTGNAWTNWSHANPNNRNQSPVWTNIPNTWTV